MTHNLSHVESVLIKMSINKKTFIVGPGYRPPNSETEPSISFFESIRQFNVESTDIIIGGDYNIDLLKISTSDSSAVQFYNTINYLSMVATITRPTLNARTSCTLPDNFFVTNLRNFKAGILRIELKEASLHLKLHSTLVKVLSIQLIGK